MSVLIFDKPKKVASTEEWNATHSSDSLIPGTYSPNMSREDLFKWKAKHIKGQSPRVEIRKTVIGKGCGAQMLIIVTKERVKMSANGTMIFEEEDWKNLYEAVAEAKALL